MSDLFVQTAKQLEALAKEHSAALVGFSGGKESLACASLCSRFFRRIAGYHLHFAPGLQLTKDRLADARKRFRMECVEYPAPACLDGLAKGYYSDPDARYAFKPLSIIGYGEIAAKQLGIPLIVSGARISDYRNRKRQIECEKRKNVIFPIAEWSKAHVELYLRQQGISLPESDGRVSTGLNNSAASLLWLHDAHRDDFRKIAKLFPYIWAQPAQRALRRVAHAN